MTHTFNLHGGGIRLIVSDHSQKYRKATGLTIDPRLWDNKAKSLRAKCKDAKVYEKLRIINIKMEEKEREGASAEEAIAYALGIEEEKENRTPSFNEFFEEWANRDTPQMRQRKNTMKLIHDCMGENYDWHQVDSAYYSILIQKLKDRGYSINYIGSVIKKLKTVMSEGYKMKYHTNEDYHQFKSPMEQASAVWLTREEVDRIIGLKLTDETEKKVQDLFILGYYTAMRYSDYSRLSMDNIKNGKIYMAQKKTSGMVVIPASPMVVSALKRNGGSAPSLSQMAYNRIIKRLAFKARIFDKVIIVKSKGHTHTQEMVEKYTQVSSHSCRRSAITALHLSGVPLHQLMMISGHKDIQSLQRYLRMTKEENAEALKSNPFFS